jgi:hypothetical protein
MKKIIPLLVLLTFSINLCAQKKLVPVTQSEMTGIQLPEGSKKDGRFLSDLAGKVLLELESKKANAGINKLEILELPPVAQTNFTADSLVERLAAAGWTIVQVNDDTKYVWIQKESRFLMAYFSMDKKNTALYFGEPSTPPNLQSAQPQEGNQQ